MIDRFSKDEFDAALSQYGAASSFQSGQYVYTISATDFARVNVYSSIDASGIAADTGMDSIRVVMEVDREDGRPFYSKDGTEYVTRVPGWSRRLHEKLDGMMKVAERIQRPISTCADCGQPKWMFVTKKEGPNQGRPFCKCRVHNNFEWMDEPSTRIIEKKPESSWMSEAAPEHEPEPERPKYEPTFMANNKPDDSWIDADIAEPVTYQLSPYQAEAVNAPLTMPVRIGATAGSGKTTSLAHRYKAALNIGYTPADILVVTFGKAASGDMYERFCKIVPEIAGNEDARANISTIHAFCNRALNSIGLGRKVLTNSDYRIRKHCTEAIERFWGSSSSMDRGIPGMHAEAEVKVPKWWGLFAAINFLKSECLGPEEHDQKCVEMWGQYHGSRVAKARTYFDGVLRSNGFITFADMLYEVDWILMHNVEPYASDFRSRFKLVMVDEAQDTVQQAMRILTDVSGGKITVVGDCDQLLYRFIGATPEDNMYEGFDGRYPNNVTCNLPVNYRSTRSIINMAARLIANNYGGDHGYDMKYLKTMLPRDNAEDGSEPTFVQYEDEVEEAFGIATDISVRLNNGEKPGSIFVLARTRAQLANIEGACMREGFPFINACGGSFWLMRHVRMMIAYMKLAIDGDDKEAFNAVYNVSSKHFMDRTGSYSSTRYLGPEFLTKSKSTIEGARSVNYGSWARGARDLVDFVEMIGDQLRSNGLVAALDMVRYDCIIPYLKDVDGEADDDGVSNGKFDDLESVVDIAQRLGTPEALFAFVADAIEAARANKDKRWDDYVVLATYHKVKGMERDTVYMAGVSESPLDAERPYGLLPHTFSLIAAPANDVLVGSSIGRVDDERCITFVGITRAAKNVNVSSIMSYRGKPYVPSRFCYEMGIIDQDK